MLKHFGVDQPGLAEVMGVKVDRVKSLALDRARNLRRDEVTRLLAKFPLREAWLIDGEEPALAPAGAKSGREVQAPPSPSPGAGVADPPGARYLLGDAELLQSVVKVTASAIEARGLVLPPPKRLRLYWAVFELSLPVGRVNQAAIEPLLTLASTPG